MRKKMRKKAVEAAMLSSRRGVEGIALNDGRPAGQISGRCRRCFAQEPSVPAVFSKLLSYLIIAIYASLTAVTPARSQSPARGPAALANGTWTVQGREIPGTRCGHWLVRLTTVYGRLSGVVSLARSSVLLQDLSLLPDGSFSGTTQAGVVGATYASAYKVTGKFNGDTVHLTLENDICPARPGVAMRHAAGH